MDKEALKNNDVEVLLNLSIHNITQSITENDLKQIEDEATIQYLKNKIQTLKESTNNIDKTCIKLEDQDVLLQTEKNDIQHNIEILTNSLGLRKQLYTALIQQIDIKQNELTTLQDKCDTNVNFYQKEYEGIKNTFENNHLYAEYKNIQMETLKSDIKMKILEKKFLELKKQHKLRQKINSCLFNQSTVQLVQAIVDSKKINNKLTVKTTTRVNVQDGMVQPKIPNTLFNMETISPLLKTLPFNLPYMFEASRTTHNDHYHKIALEIQNRSEPKQKEWKQRKPLLNLTKRSYFVDNTNTVKTSANVISNSQSNTSIPVKETVSPSFNTENTKYPSYQQTPHQLFKQPQLLENVSQECNEKRPLTTTDNSSKSKRINRRRIKRRRINIIDVQNIPPVNEMENENMSTYLNYNSERNKNGFAFPSQPVPLTHRPNTYSQINTVSDVNLPSSISQISTADPQNKMLPHTFTQENYTFESSVNNTSKPDLKVSAFFDKSKTTEINKHLEKENFPNPYVQNIMGSYMTESEMQGPESFSDQPFINLMSPMNMYTDNESNGSVEPLSNQPQNTLNFGQTNAPQPNESQKNSLFSDNNNYDKIALEIQNRSEQKQKERMQRKPSFNLTKRSYLVDNTNTVKTSANVISNSQSSTPTQVKETVSASFNPENTKYPSYQQTPHQLFKQPQLLENVSQESNGKRSLTTTDNSLKSKKMNIIEGQTFQAVNEMENENMSTYSNYNSERSKNEFAFPSQPVPLTHRPNTYSQINTVSDVNLPSSISQISTADPQNKMLPHTFTQENYTFESSVDNTSKPDLKVSPFFDKSKTTEINKHLEKENITNPYVQNIMGSYMTESEMQGPASFSDQPFINLMSPMSMYTDDESNGNMESLSNQPRNTLNFGQTNAPQPNESQNNLLFSGTNMFNMF